MNLFIGLPDFYRSVLACRGEITANGAEGDVGDEIGVSGKRLYGKVGPGEFPDFHGMVFAARGQIVGGRTEGDAGDVIGVSSERLQFSKFSISEMPDFYCVIIASEAR